MKLAVYSKWEEKRDKLFLAMLDYNPYAEVIDLGYGDGNSPINSDNDASFGFLYYLYLNINYQNSYPKNT